jgi:hypothetical protein
LSRGPFDLPLGLRAVGPAGADAEAQWVAKRRNSGFLSTRPPAAARVVDNDGAHLVERQLPRHAAE